jgi:hypothetical protein
MIAVLNCSSPMSWYIYFFMSTRLEPIKLPKPLLWFFRLLQSLVVLFRQQAMMASAFGQGHVARQPIYPDSRFIQLC